MSLEQIVRPFADRDVTPVRQAKAGQAGVEAVLVQVGRKGGTKALSFSGDFTMTSYMVRVHKEKPDTNNVL